KIPPEAAYFSVDDNFDAKQLAGLSRRIFYLNKLHLLTEMLTPFDQTAFKIRFGDFKRVNVDVRFDYARQQELLCKAVSFIHIHRADNRFEGVAKKRTLLVGITDHPCIVFHEFVKPQLPGQLV